MNDPGLDDAIADEANALDMQQISREKSSATSGKDNAPRSLDSQESLKARWWLASTAYPLTAGTFGPMASAFNVCCLAQTWRMKPDSSGGYLNIPDPKWVIGVNAISLVFAVVANVALSLNMARRIRFSVAQPIIILGWYISSALLVGILIPFGVLMYRPENAGHIYTQAYFYGTFAAGLYFILASLLTVTAYGAYKGHYSRRFSLTNSQRTLMLQTIIFCIYLLGGAAVYAKVEGWRFLDAVYYADYTLLTIGVGNISPATHLGRGLLFPYAVGGIVILGLIISSIRTLMLEHGRQKIGSAIADMTRKLLVKEALSDRNRFRAIVPDLRTDGNEEDMTEREKQKREFITMRRVRQIASVQHKWVSLCVSLIVWMALWLIGAVVFWRSETHQPWTYFEALYFAYTSLLTIGYGDVYPESSLGKAFFVFWSLLAVPTITILISNIGDTLIRFIRDLTLYLGALTILPGEEAFLSRVKDMFRREKWLQEATGETNNARDILNDSNPDLPRAGYLEAKELQKEEVARQHGDIAAQNLHHYHYILFREIRKMILLAKSSSTKEFDYLEWEYYLLLFPGSIP
ncbi:hypothetical protein N7468_009352 [Penicillium chermesinum]|uniref:Potassium channel domain-containing protein n=1 Tax=Penicillium chermesinum TaxID=63820 RepID=A0A9W9NK60_9EURO|nr:uncharacterized protein N7468_009352 [Penicillium chermesinum]KAJ5220148.1 hypothetical protein N7468_009352 [Penicillium chermesinum]